MRELLYLSVAYAANTGGVGHILFQRLNSNIDVNSSLSIVPFLTTNAGGDPNRYRTQPGAEGDGGHPVWVQHTPELCQVGNFCLVWWTLSFQLDGICPAHRSAQSSHLLALASDFLPGAARQKVILPLFPTKGKYEQ